MTIGRRSTAENVAALVAAAAESRPRHEALIYRGGRYTYRALDSCAMRAAAGLRRIGVRPGGRVALFLPNCPEFVIAYLAAARLGAIAVSLDAQLKYDEVAFIVRDCGAQVLITDRARAAWLRSDLPADVIVVDDHAPGHGWSAWLEADEPAIPPAAVESSTDLAILYTSGTTGTPKGATLSHGNVLFTARAAADCCGVTLDDRLLLIVPLSHCFGQNVVLNQAFVAGATVVLMDTFDPAAAIQTIERERVTMLFGVPALYAIVAERCQDPRSLATVRYCHSGADSLGAALAERWHRKFDTRIHQGYGLTESSPLAIYNPSPAEFPTSIGKPIPEVEIRLADENGDPVAEGDVGQILVRGPNVMKGYWNRPEQTALAVKDGWLRTGDVGRRDAEGNFYVVDRLKDMINVAGLKVFPAEVEAVLKSHPKVRDAAVFAVPDATMGEQVRAAVCAVAPDEPSSHELIAFCRERLAAFKVPAYIAVAGSLPRNSKGKLLRRVLREQAASELPRHASADVN